jgi:PadR family transcriptional regulator PadR
MADTTGRRDVRQDVRQGTLDLLVLRVVALEPTHGYRIAQRIQQISQNAFLVRQGSLYPALHRLEEQGWLKASWQDTDQGRETKVYAITRAGRKQLESEHEAWRRFVQAMSLVLDGPARPDPA